MVFSLRYDNVCKISMTSRRHRRAVSQAIGRRLLTAEAPDQSQGSTCAICDGRRKSHCEKGFCEDFGLLLPVPFHHCFIRIFLSLLPLPGRQTVEAWEPPKTQYFIGNRGALDIKVLSIYSLHFGYLRCPCQHQCTNPPYTSSSSKQH
jgi:hypothetical protein